MSRAMQGGNTVQGQSIWGLRTVQIETTCISSEGLLQAFKHFNIMKKFVKIQPKTRLLME